MQVISVANVNVYSVEWCC